MNLVIVATHPVSYQLPLFLAIQNSNTRIKTKTIFLNDVCLKTIYIKSYKGYVDMDVDKYLNVLNHSFLNNISPFKSHFFTSEFKFSFLKGIHFFTRINPSIFIEVFKSDYVLIHGYDYLTYFFALLASFLFRKKLIFRGEATIREPKQRKSIFRKFKLKYIDFFLKYSNFILYSCNGNKEYFSQWPYTHKLVSFPCCVDNDYCKENFDEEKKNFLRNHYNIGENKIVFGYCGRLTKRKNIETLIRACCKLSSNQLKKIHIFLIGGGDTGECLEKLAKKNNIDITITGFLSHEETIKHFNILDIFCMPSLYDPSPKSLNEAMNFSLPIIVSKYCGTAKDLVIENLNGFIFDPNDVGALAKKIRFFLQNKQLIKEFGLASSKIIQDKNPENSAKCLIEAIEDFKYR